MIIFFNHFQFLERLLFFHHFTLLYYSFTLIIIYMLLLASYFWNIFFTLFECMKLTNFSTAFFIVYVFAVLTVKVFHFGSKLQKRCQITQLSALNIKRKCSGHSGTWGYEESKSKSLKSYYLMMFQLKLVILDK